MVVKTLFKGMSMVKALILRVGKVRLDTSSGWKEWLNNPVQSKSLVDSAGVSHCLPRTGHTGVQNNSSCIKICNKSQKVF